MLEEQRALARVDPEPEVIVVTPDMVIDPGEYDSADHAYVQWSSIPVYLVNDQDQQSTFKDWDARIRYRRDRPVNSTE